MSDGRLSQDLATQGFNPELYVSKLSEQGEDTLLDTKQKVHVLSEKTAQELKKNVYKNYTQFIETAREISKILQEYKNSASYHPVLSLYPEFSKNLEGEMYQVSHMLTEQKTLMSSLMEMSLVGDKAVVEETPKEKEPENPEEETRRNLAFLLEKVEGCSSVTEVPGRQLIHNGDLIELDIEAFAQIQRVHMFLLNDSLMIASWLSNRRGPVRYKFQGLYELDNLAIVNIRDQGPVKNSFKVLMFPDSKIYQADSSKSKRQWLDILEDTKKKKAARDKQKKEAALRLVEQQKEQQKEAAASKEEENKNPFSEPDEVDSKLIAMETDMLHADWLQELPEDLDMCIAQRDFEGAVDLVERVNAHLDECPKTPAVKEFRARIDHRIKQLTEGLMSELQVSPERSLRGGPRAARRAVAQLIRLGKSAQACDLFLKNRSAIIKYNIRQLKFEGATPLYISCLCGVFFNSLSETGREFIKAFPEHYGCFSAFIVWMEDELENFVKIFKRHVFDSKSSMATIAECVSTVSKHCAEMSSAGIDVGFCMDAMISTELEKIIVDNRDQVIAGIKHRSADDRWRPMNHLNEKDCTKFVDEMASAGIDLTEYVYDDCFISLTMSTAQFCRACIITSQCMLLMHTLDRESLITDSLVQIFKAVIDHIETSFELERFAKERPFILKNAHFIIETLMAKIEQMYKDQNLPFPYQLTNLKKEYRKLHAEAGT